MNTTQWFNIPPRRPRGLAEGEHETVTSNLPLFEGVPLRFGRTEGGKFKWGVWYIPPDKMRRVLFLAKTRKFFFKGEIENRDAHVYQMLQARKIKRGCPPELVHLLPDSVIAFAAMADLEGIPETIKTTGQYKKYKTTNT